MVASWWVVVGCFLPPNEQQVLQGYLYDAIELTDEAADMLIICCASNPTAFNPQETSPIAIHLGQMAEAFTTIKRRDVIDDLAAAEKCRLRIDAVMGAFVAAVDMVNGHAGENFAATQLPHNRAFIVKFITKNVQGLRSVSVLAENIHRANQFTLLMSARSTACITFCLPAHTSFQADGFKDSTVQAPSPAAKSSPRGGGGGTGTCRQFARTGESRFGNRCTFLSKTPGKHKTVGGGDNGGDGKSGGRQTGGDQNNNAPPRSPPEHEPRPMTNRSEQFATYQAAMKNRHDYCQPDLGSASKPPWAAEAPRLLSEPRPLQQPSLPPLLREKGPRPFSSSLMTAPAPLPPPPPLAPPLALSSPPDDYMSRPSFLGLRNMRFECIRAQNGKGAYRLSKLALVFHGFGQSLFSSGFGD